MKSGRELLAAWPTEVARNAFFLALTTRYVPCIGVDRLDFTSLDARRDFESVISEYNLVEERQFLRLTS